MDMKKLFLCLFLAFSSTALTAQQKLNASSLQQLRVREDSLKIYADSMINAGAAGTRFMSDSNFVKGFVRALKTPYSFDYPFDSLKSISRL